MNILNPSFKYTNAAKSQRPGYLRKKFQRLQRELREQQEAKAKEAACPQCGKAAAGTA